MVQSLNKKIDLVIPATSYLGFTSYGKIMVGDNAFEYYNDRNVDDYIQIPWNEVDYIAASVIGKKHISRFVIFTKRNGKYTFSSRNNKKLLRVVREYIPSERMVKSDTFLKVIKRGLISLFKSKRKK